MALTQRQKRLIATYSVRGLTAHEINLVTRIPGPEIRAYCKKQGVVLVKLRSGPDAERPEPSNPEELRARWATLLGPMKARLKEAILYDAA